MDTCIHQHQAAEATKADRRYFEQAEAHDLDRARHAEGAVGKYNYCMTLSLRGKKHSADHFHELA